MTPERLKKTLNDFKEGRISEDLARLFRGFSRPDRPVEVFERESDAIEWGQLLSTDLG